MKTRKAIDVENIAYKFRILPEAIHIDYYFPRWFGCRRFLWNHMLADKTDFYMIMGFDLKNEVTDYKEEYTFLNEVDSLVLANTKLDLSKSAPKDKSRWYPEIGYHIKGSGWSLLCVIVV